MTIHALNTQANRRRLPISFNPLFPMLQTRLKRPDRLTCVDASRPLINHRVGKLSRPARQSGVRNGYHPAPRELQG